MDRQAKAEGARVVAGGGVRWRVFPADRDRERRFGQLRLREGSVRSPRHHCPVKSFGEAIRKINESDYGLQAGVFTNSLEKALVAFENVEVGGVIINDVPTYRIDHMPYGGVKSSGLGREGLKYTIEEMTEPRLMVINRLESEAVSLD